MFQLLLLCVVVAVNVNGFDFTCPDACLSSPCDCDSETDLNCGIDTCHSNGCDQCLSGYYKQSYNHKCVQCQESTGDGCSHCSDFIGCQQCNTGYTRRQDTQCSMYYCDPIGQTPVPAPTSITASVDLSDLCLNTMTVTDTTSQFDGDYVLLGASLNDDQHFVVFDNHDLQFGNFPLSFDCASGDAAGDNPGFGFAFYDASDCTFYYLDEATFTASNEDSSLLSCSVDYSGTYEFANDGTIFTLCYNECDSCGCSSVSSCFVHSTQSDCDSSCLGNCEWDDSGSSVSGTENGYCKISDCEAVDLVFVVDETGSIGAANWPFQVSAAAQVILSATSDDTHYGIITFGGDGDQVTERELDNADHDREDVSNFIENIEYNPYGSTHVANAVSAGIDMFDAHTDASRRKVMVLLTDGGGFSGGPPCDGGTTETTLTTRLFNGDIATVAIAIGASVEAADLNCLSSAAYGLDGISVSLANFDSADFAEIRKFTDPFPCGTY